jgi:preprotein translocase subunit SecY
MAVFTLASDVTASTVFNAGVTPFLTASFVDLLLLGVAKVFEAFKKVLGMNPPFTI